MENYLFNSNNLFAIISPALAVFFGITSLFLYWHGRRLKLPVWGIQSNNLVNGQQVKLENLDISYRGRPVENLTVSKVWFWNKGKELVLRQDIVENNRIRVEARGNTRIQDIKVLDKNSETFTHYPDTTDSDQQVVYLDFDFLRNNQGALLQVIHSGTSSEDIEVKGEIRDRVLKKIDIRVEDLRPTRAARIVGRVFKSTTVRQREIGRVLITFALTLCGFMVLALWIILQQGLSEAASEIAGLSFFIGVFALVHIRESLRIARMPPVGVGIGNSS